VTSRRDILGDDRAAAIARQIHAYGARLIVVSIEIWPYPIKAVLYCGGVYSLPCEARGRHWFGWASQRARGNARSPIICGRGRARGGIPVHDRGPPNRDLLAPITMSTQWLAVASATISPAHFPVRRIMKPIWRLTFHYASGLIADREKNDDLVWIHDYRLTRWAGCCARPASRPDGSFFLHPLPKHCDCCACRPCRTWCC